MAIIVVTYERLPSGIFVKVTKETQPAGIIAALRQRIDTLNQQILAKTSAEISSIKDLREQIKLLKEAKNA